MTGLDEEFSELEAPNGLIRWESTENSGQRPKMRLKGRRGHTEGPCRPPRGGLAWQWGATCHLPLQDCSKDYKQQRTMIESYFKIAFWMLGGEVTVLIVLSLP